MQSCEICQKCSKNKHRSEEEKKKLIKRLNIIEGQIKGIKQMINDERYCNEILIQVAAVDKSLKSLGSTILKSHLKTCVATELKKDNYDIIDETMDLIERIR